MATDDKFDRLIEEIKQIRNAAEEAYRRGWNDALVAVGESVAGLGSIASSGSGAGGGQAAQTLPSLRQKGTGPGVEGAGHAAQTLPSLGQRGTGRPVRRGVLPTLVRKIIEDEPGLTGVQIVHRAQQLGDHKERSIRTALRRLRLDETIKQINARWHMADVLAGGILYEFGDFLSEETAETADQADPAAPLTTTKEDQMDPP